MVPFCGVFLKELSDALDGTASIISLKPPPDHTEDSIEVQASTNISYQAERIRHVSIIHPALSSSSSSLCLTTAASTTSCLGPAQMDYTSQRKKPPSATSSRLSGTLHPFFYSPLLLLSLFFSSDFLLSSPQIL